MESKNLSTVCHCRKIQLPALSWVLKALQKTDFTLSPLWTRLGTGSQSNTILVFLSSHTIYKPFYHASVSILRDRDPAKKTDQPKKDKKGQVIFKQISSPNLPTWRQLKYLSLCYWNCFSSNRDSYCYCRSKIYSEIKNVNSIELLVFSGLNSKARFLLVIHKKVVCI